MEQPNQAFGYTMAKQFSRMFNFQQVINGYFLPDKMPSFGQLGCSGFIVAEVATGKVIHKATPALMQYGPQAFSWVERMFQSLSPSVASSRQTPPDDAIRVKLQNLQSQPTLNGTKGYLIRKDDHNAQRFIILLDNGNQVSLRPNNFVELEEGDDEEDIDDKEGEVEVKEVECGDSCDNCTSCDCGKDELSRLLELKTPTLGFTEVDKEHEECDKALRYLVQTKSIPALNSFRDAVKQHFEHEELMMQEADFGNAKQTVAIGNKLSAYAGHIADHQGILQLLDSVLEEYAVTKETLVCKDSLIQITQRFTNHIENYDKLYHDAFTTAGIR